MKFYSSTFEEYLRAVQKYNLHPDLFRGCISGAATEQRPWPEISDIPNMIFFGPSGVGKYSQVLHFISKYSPRKLAVSKKLSMQYNKQNYCYPISDVHFEIDMSLLGCNSKLIWHEIFSQIVDIISIRPEKVGILVCKNFHAIHAELLEIFYSYMQQYSSRVSATGDSQIQIKFIFITEHMSFIPTSIVNNCFVVKVPRPSREMYEHLVYLEDVAAEITDVATKETPEVIPRDITNIKEFLSFVKGYERISIRKPAAKVYKNGVKTAAAIPLRMKKSHVIVCDEIIRQMKEPKKLSFTAFRDAIYDIFIYNLDVAECVMYITENFIREISARWSGESCCLASAAAAAASKVVAARKISAVLSKAYVFLQYYNNNYRPIYHLESYFIYIIITHESEKGV
jgi:hypothetical protein